ncbi:MAG: dTMP kinase [Armatimonadetes bacterium]|nr:dTMP kinase [Armatimonadota bacterium]
MRKALPKNGFFITLEGIEGSGKSSLAARLRKKLAADGFEVFVTAEPGGCPLSDSIRKLLLGSENVISDRAELLLFEAARAEHVDTKIRPALERGAIVICDRFSDSSLAYQGYARGIDLVTVKMLNDYATSGLRPDLTLLLDLPAEAGLARHTKRDRISSERLAFHEAVRNGFLALATAEKDRIVVIDATKPLEEVAREALSVIESRIEKGVPGGESLWSRE